MGIFSGNSTCPLPKDEADLLIKGDPILGSLTFQHVILIVSVTCTGVTGVLSLWLIFKHLHRYSEPNQQRQIIRIIFTPVVFSLFSALSILNYSASKYMIPLRDLYEVFALASIFYLFTEYVAPNPQTRDAFFATLENHKKKGGRFSFSKKYTVIPGGSLRWFHTRWVAVFTYVFVMVVTTIAEEASQGTGTYCSTSFSPRFAYIWIMIIQNVAVTIAVTAVVNYYLRLRGTPEFEVHRPLLKIISFKLIVFVNFIQDLVFSFLFTTEDVVHGTHKVTGKDLSIGIPALVVAVEQVAFAIFFHYSFRSREYHESEKQFLDSPSRMGTFRAAVHAFNPWDLIHGVGHAVTLLLAGVTPWSKADSNRSGKRGFGRGRGRGAYEEAAQNLEPLRESYPPTYQPQGEYQNAAALQSPYHSPNQSLAAQGAQDTQYLGAGDDMTRYERSRSRSRGREERELYQRPSVETERDRLNPSAAHVRSHSTDGGADAASMRSMV